MARRAVIIGAGPAGLTAALEMLRHTDIQPIVLEASQEIGGLARTVRYKGNRMDIGGHRFFSKSERVMQWWLELMPLESAGNTGELVMLMRPRRSRIYSLHRFFEYPIRLTWRTMANLGVWRMVKIAASYAAARLRPVREERNLEDFLIHRFGRELYRTFFKSYTEKVWGVPCAQISAEWGAQRVRGLSLTRAVRHFVRGLFAAEDLAQSRTDTSLIERFLYPKLGPGQMWEHVAEKITAAGGEVRLGWKAEKILAEGDRVVAIEAVNAQGECSRLDGDVFLSTMPMKELVRAFEAGGTDVPAKVRAVSEGLEYRDFIMVGVLARRLDIVERDGGPVRDTWIYVQEPEVLLGRLQIFNNWSPAMVADADTVWLGLEYFCAETDALWSMPDEELKRFAAGELETIGILKSAEVLDAHVVRVPKSYPAYFGSYDRFDELREWVDGFENLFLIGRNGMHKYNNQDHSMLTAMTVVDGLAAGHVEKAAVWAINTEQEYHEEKTR